MVALAPARSRANGTFDSPLARRFGVGIAEQSDEDLLGRYRDGNQPAADVLLSRYRHLARIKARSYFLVGADEDDLVQEAMIGLYKAIRDFSPERQVSFRTFADVCITRQLITAIRTAQRQKHAPLNSCVSLQKPLESEEGEDRILLDLLSAGDASDPAESVVSSDEIRNIKLAVSEILSDFEMHVLRQYVDGDSYQDIADRLDREVKSIDNALQRIKRKVRQHLQARETEEVGLA
jgi:RNA polymerase sporulation-specific sigma factor